jgi:hypothetical protein
MAVMTELFRRILDGQVVRYVSVLKLDDVFNEKKPEEKKFAGSGRIEYEITDDEIILTMEGDVPGKETIVIPLTDDLSFGIKPIGDFYGHPADAPCFRMEIFGVKLPLAITLDFMDSEYKKRTNEE